MGQRLLIVDSDRRFIQDHQVALESAFEVDFLYGTDGALARLEAGDHAAILLCVEASDHKGYALCSAIRRAPALANLKVILISAKATEEEYARHRSLKGRADLYLHKPILPVALVAALTPLVPLRLEDPDNPLGDLAGADLGDEWLDSLRSELEVDALAAPAPQSAPPAPKPPQHPTPELPLSHQATQKLPTVSKDAGKVELLEDRIKDLEAKLVAKAAALETQTQELDDLRHTHASVTRNLDDLEQRQAEAATVHEKLRETQQALEQAEALAAQWAADAAAAQESLATEQAEQDRLLEDLKDTHTLLGEKTGELLALMETQQALQAQLEEARAREELQRRSEQALAASQERLQQLEVSLGAAQETRDTLVGDLHQARTQLAEREAQAQDLSARSASLDSQLRDSLAALTEQEDLARTVQTRITELEAAHEGALQAAALRAEALETRIQESHQAREAQEALGRELESFRLRTVALTAELTERSAEVSALQERVSQQDAASLVLEAEGQACKTARQDLEAAFAQLDQQVVTLQADHEHQQLELLAGIDDREAQLGRLNATLDGQRERILTLEQEKAELEAQLQATAGRTLAITELLTELEGKARQALNLAKVSPS